MPCFSSTPKKLTCKCGIIPSVIPEDMVENFIVEDEYLIDTGCTITHLGNIEYINYNILPHKYNNYPYNRKGEIIFDESLRKDSLKLINEMIVFEKNILVGDSTNILHRKNEVLFREDAKLSINRLNYVKFYNATFPDTTKPSGNFSFRSKKEILWPEKVENLLGLNIIVEVGGTIQKLFLNSSSFIFNMANKLMEGINYYPVKQIKPKLKIFSIPGVFHLFGGIIQDKRISDNSENYFYLTEEYFYYSSINEYEIHEYETSTIINILVLQKYTQKLLKELQKKINLHEYIDGYILTDSDPPYPNKIWIKNFKMLNKKSDIPLNRIITGIDYFSIYSKNEIQKLQEFELSDWNIDIDLDKKITL